MSIYKEIHIYIYITEPVIGDREGGMGRESGKSAASAQIDDDDILSAQRLECSPMARETWVQSQVESYQRL